MIKAVPGPYRAVVFDLDGVLWDGEPLYHEAFNVVLRPMGHEVTQDDYEDADVEQQYLPDELVGRVFYEPSDIGYERHIKAHIDDLRRKRLEARRRTGGQR